LWLIYSISPSAVSGNLKQNHIDLHIFKPAKQQANIMLNVD